MSGFVNANESSINPPDQQTLVSCEAANHALSHGYFSEFVNPRIIGICPKFGLTYPQHTTDQQQQINFCTLYVDSADPRQQFTSCYVHHLLHQNLSTPEAVNLNGPDSWFMCPYEPCPEPLLDGEFNFDDWDRSLGVNPNLNVDLPLGVDDYSDGNTYKYIKPWPNFESNVIGPKVQKHFLQIPPKLK